MDLITREPRPLPALAGSDLQHDLLNVDVTVSYKATPPVLSNARLRVAPGEIVGLVGLSGSGKSTLAMTVLGLHRYKGAQATGVVEYSGTNLLQLNEPAMRKLRGSQIAFVPQSPLAALNPALTIGKQFREAWLAHSKDPDYRTPVIALLRDLCLPATDLFLSQYPRELSVGMAQRVLIAMAVLHRPRLLIADEPTSALDPITQSELLALFQHLNRDFGMAILYISHDLLSVGNLCHQLAILSECQVVECDTTTKVLSAPEHPYTRRLINAIPCLSLYSQPRRQPITGK